MSYTIRRAEPEEYQRVGEVSAEGYRADGLLLRSDGTNDDYYEAVLRGAAERAAEAELLVAVEGGDILGTVTWCPKGSPWRQLALADHQGEFRMLSVAPLGRRRGVGRALVADCLDRARAAGQTEVVLASLPEMVGAHAIYRQFGFTRAPELDFTPMPMVHLWGFRLSW